MLYQVSTATAPVEGLYQGAVRVSTRREHGDLGFGTFEHLDGEIGAGSRCRDQWLSEYLEKGEHQLLNQ